MTHFVRFVLIAMLFWASACLAQTTGSATLDLQIRIKAVQGGAQFRPPAQTRWQPLKVDMQLPEGVEFRTGPKGAIQFTIGTDQIFRVDRLTVVKVLRASLRPDGTIQTDVGMQYGRVSKDVDAPERPHDDTIVSPSSTLAVRGTRVSLYDQPPYTPEAVSLTGRAVFDTVGRQVVAFGAKGEGTAIVNSDQPDPANNALNTRLVDPSDAYARTPDEQKLLADLLTNGAVVIVSNPDKLPIVRNATPPADPLVPPVADAALEFVVRWSANTNIDLALISQGPATTHEQVYPVLGLNSTPLGGHTLFDNQGGPKGGFEIITYPNFTFISPDLEALFALNQGPVPTTVTFNAFLKVNGVLTPLGIIQANQINGLRGVLSAQLTTAVIQPGANDAVIVALGDNVLFSNGNQFPKAPTIVPGSSPAPLVPQPSASRQTPVPNFRSQAVGGMYSRFGK